MRTSRDFTQAARRGRRVSAATVVLHVARQPGLTVGGTDEPATTRVGFVVSKNVGGSVVRHTVTRRLRAQLNARLHQLPDASLVVVRALPASSSASSAQLGADLDAALANLAAA